MKYPNRFKKGSTPWNKQRRISKKCLYCNKTFQERESLSQKRKFCSRKCVFSYQKGKKNNGNGGRVEGKCFVCKKTFTHWRHERDRKACSKKCKYTLMSKALSGKKNHNWKGGVSPRPLNSKRYRDWRDGVFKRDNYVCVNCGYSDGRILNAHHKKDWSSYPKLRYDIDNGETLCVSCHKKTDSFGKKT